MGRQWANSQGQRGQGAAVSWGGSMLGSRVLPTVSGNHWRSVGGDQMSETKLDLSGDAYIYLHTWVGAATIIVFIIKKKGWALATSLFSLGNNTAPGHRLVIERLWGPGIVNTEAQSRRVPSCRDALDWSVAFCTALSMVLNSVIPSWTQLTTVSYNCIRGFQEYVAWSFSLERLAD